MVRHGQTANNRANPPRLQGSGIDAPLDETGLSQAQQVGQLLARLPISAVYTSPLQRAHQTANAIAERHGIEAEPLDRLREANVGRWEGSNWPHIRQNDEEAYQRFIDDPHLNGYPEGERLAEVLDRVKAELEARMQQHLGQHIACTAHSVVNRVYMTHLLEMAGQKGRIMPQGNGAVNLIRWRNGKAKAITVNATYHLV